MQLKNQGLHAQFLLLQVIRDFFNARDFRDVLTPPMVSHPGLEPHLHPFQTKGLGPHESSPYYLQTSPEFHMKELLSLGLDKIFTLSYCFRNEPKAQAHRPQFIMLEWYRQGERYESIMNDTEELLEYCAKKLKEHGLSVNPSLETPLVKKTMEEVFQEFCNISLFEILDAKEFSNIIRKKWPEVPLGKDVHLEFDDLFHLLFLNIIEPRLKKYPKLLIYEYPASQAALSTLKKSDPRVCERFEVYLNGIELCNAFNELCSPSEQAKRANEQLKEKKELYNYDLPYPQILIESLERGIKSPSAGIALGVERLLMGLTSISDPFWPNSNV